MKRLVVGMFGLVVLGVLVYAANVSNLSSLFASSKLAVLPSFECGVSTVQDADGNTYNTLLIGTQCWMKQNMRVGTRISGATAQTNNATIEKYCYNDLDSNCTSNHPNQPDGGLYQWNEAMQYSTTPGAQGICPSGWHIPTHDEFTTLERAVCTSGTCATDFPYDTTTTGYRGTNEGTKLKSNGDSGFEVNLAGYSISGGSFGSFDTYGRIWSSSEYGGADAWIRRFGSATAQIDRTPYEKNTFAVSVRCLKDDPSTKNPKVTVATTPALQATDSLNQGLVGHWTFDGPDVVWSDTTSEIKDISGGGSNGNAVNGMTMQSVTPGKLGQAISFAGVDYIDLGSSTTFNVDPGDARTFSMWIKNGSLPTTRYFNWKEGSCIGWSFFVNTSGKIGQRLRTSAAGCTGYSTYENLSAGSTNYSDGAWHHVVGVFDRPNTVMTLYVDGMFSASRTVDNTLAANSGVFRFGTQWDNSAPYIGSLDDVRVYDRALSADEVMRLYQMGEGTKIATTIKNPLSPLEQGLVGYWTFDGSDIDWANSTAEIDDVSGYGNNGDAQNGIGTQSVTPGCIGQAVSFDLTNDVIDVGSAANLDDVFSGGGSISAWVKSGTSWIGGNKDILRKDGVSSGFYFAHSGPPNTAYTQVRFLRTFSTTNGQWRSSANSFNAGEWFHVVVTYDDSSTANDPIIYINSVSDTASEFTTPSGSPLSDASANMKIGNASGSTLDDVRVYDRILSPEEVQQLYQMGH